jgi:hypothetical protein
MESGMFINTNLEEIFKNKKFSQDIYYNIYKILEEEGESYSKNSNGVFVNLNNCKNCTVDKIYKYIQNIEKNNHEYEMYIENTEKKIDTLKKSFEKKKTVHKEPKRRYNNLTKAGKQVLDKELVKEKPVYRGVYKRIYNSMKGYKNKPKKEVEEQDAEDIELDIEDNEVEQEAEPEPEVDEDLFGASDSEPESEVEIEE